MLQLRHARVEARQLTREDCDGIPGIVGVVHIRDQMHGSRHTRHGSDFAALSRRRSEETGTSRHATHTTQRAARSAQRAAGERRRIELSLPRWLLALLILHAHDAHRYSPDLKSQLLNRIGTLVCINRA